MTKEFIVYIWSIFLICSCSEVSERTEFNETDNLCLIEVLDSALTKDPAGSVYLNVKNHELDSCFLPQKSHCGGSVTGFYENDSLVYIYSYNGAEFGYRKSSVFFVDGLVYRIDFEEHLADFDTYNQIYTAEETLHEANLTYIDNRVLFMYVKDTVHPLVEQGQPKLKRELLECGLEMKRQLEMVQNCR